MTNRAKKRRTGLTLIEVLITLMLVAIAFGLLNKLVATQSGVVRYQSEKERFLVDSDQLFRLLAQDLATAFAAEPTLGSDILKVEHLTESLNLKRSLPYNVWGYTPPASGPLTRGTRAQTVYRLQQGTLRQDRAEGLAPIPVSSITVMNGLNAASATVNGQTISFRIAIQSDRRLETLSRVFYAPGMVP